MKYRKIAAREIYESERSYVKKLKIFKRQIILPLFKHKILPEKDLITIFGGDAITQIIVNNEKFVSNLKSIMDHWGYYSQIGEAFLAMIPSFEPHINYAINYSYALSVLKDAKIKNPLLKDFLKTLREKKRM